MNFELTINPIESVEADIELIIIVNKDFKHQFIQDRKLLEKVGFSATQDEICLLIEKDRLYVGAENITSSNIRTAIASAIRALASTNYKTLKIASYMNNPKCTAVLRAMAEGFGLGAYNFDTYKTEKAKQPIEDITISLEEYNGYSLDIEKCAIALNKGQITAEATNFTRDIVNTTPEDCYPAIMADIAKTLSEDSTLECKILKPKELRAEKMETL